MNLVLVVHSLPRLRRLLARRPGLLPQGSRFLSFASTPPAVLAFLRERGVEPLAVPHPSLERYDRFLADYLAIMDSLAGQNGHDLLWWATDMASKNRFTSPLLPLLNEFARCLAAIEHARGQGRLLVLAAPAWPVVQALRDCAGKLGIELAIAAPPFASLLARLRGKARAWVNLAREALQSLARIRDVRAHFGDRPRLPGRPTCLIKSFVYKSSFTDNAGYRDPFFGDLAGFLARNAAGAAVLTVAVGFEDRGQCYARMKALQGSPVVPLEAYLSGLDVLLGVFRVAFGRIARPFRAAGTFMLLGRDVSALVRGCLASGGGYIQLYQYLHLAAGERLAKLHDIQSCALTFEGNPWERMFLAGLRRRKPGLPCVGYQHSVVPQASAGVFVTRNERDLCPLPDTILTTGEIPAAIIRRHGCLPAERVRPACALRYGYLFERVLPPRRPGEPFTVLVALEGVWEALGLVEYVLDQAPACPGVRFRIRAHPVMPLAKYLEWLGRTLDPAGNVESGQEASVAEDIANSDAVLYWGTTVALEALMLGRPLIHFDRGDMPSYDPLFDLTDGKWVVARDQALGPVLEEIRGLPDDQLLGRIERGRRYIRAYFDPPEDARLAGFLP